MKKSIVFALLMSLFFVQPASAQNDSKAKAILEAVSKKINGLKTLKANFSFSLKGSNGKIRDTKKGTFFMKGQKYRVQLAGQEIICDNKTVWTYMKEANEVQVSNYNPEEASISPAKLFTNFYDKEYSYKYIGEKTVNGKKCDVIEMVPNNKAKQLTKIELAFDKTSVIVGGNIWEKNGNQYNYNVSGFTANAAVQDSYFTWVDKEHPGVEKVDLR